PLLGWRAFSRSALFTLVVSSVFVYELAPWWWWWVLSGLPALIFVAAIISTNIVSDYVSLFVIRRWLAIGRKRPGLSLWIGPVVGACVIVALAIARDLLVIAFVRPIFNGHQKVYVLAELGSWYFDIRNGAAPWILPALAVHLWLPLFGLGVLGARALNA